MKGQIYVMATILILIFLILTKIGTEMPSYQAKPLLFEYYTNIREEVINTVDLALLNEKNVSTSLDDFISLSSSTLTEHGINNTTDYNIEENGNAIKVTFNLYLGSGKSFISDVITVERDVTK